MYIIKHISQSVMHMEALMIMLREGHFSSPFLVCMKMSAKSPVEIAFEMNVNVKNS